MKLLINDLFKNCQRYNFISSTFPPKVLLMGMLSGAFSLVILKKNHGFQKYVKVPLCIVMTQDSS